MLSEAVWKVLFVLQPPLSVELRRRRDSVNISPLEKGYLFSPLVAWHKKHDLRPLRRATQAVQGLCPANLA